MMPDLFRFGASSLFTDLERQLYHFMTGHYAAKHHANGMKIKRGAGIFEN